jgi:uncharacterized protein YjiS (DUF1127 family)
MMSILRLRLPALPGPGAVLIRVWDTLLLWQERTRQRHYLAALDDHMLRDMGLARADAERESSKAFWRE